LICWKNVADVTRRIDEELCEDSDHVLDGASAVRLPAWKFRSVYSILSEEALQIQVSAMFVTAHLKAIAHGDHTNFCG
jgi:hypothetical protein